MTDPAHVDRVLLPEGAEPPIRVYVNGEELTEGERFRVEGGELRFDPPLRAPPRLGLRHRVMLAAGIGVYGHLRGDTLDVRCRVAGSLRPVSVPLRRPPARGTGPG